jgi:tight adherence protein C
MANFLPILVALGISIGVLIFFLGLYSMSATTATIQERLEEYGARPLTLEEIELSQPFSERVVKPLLRSLAQAVTRFTPQSLLKDTANKLEKAGNPYNWTATEFMGFRVLAGVILGVAGFLLTSVAKVATAKGLGFALLMGFLGFTLPSIWLGQKISARKKEILKSLPDAMDLITVSVEAGLGFDLALARVVEKWDNALAKEFARFLGEVRYGKPRHAALRDMAARVDLPEFTGFVASIIQAEEMGSSIANVMRVQSNYMRIRRRQRAEELARQAPIKMIVVLIFFVFPSIFVVLLGPALIILKNSVAIRGVFGF